MVTIRRPLPDALALLLVIFNKSEALGPSLFQREIDDGKRAGWLQGMGLAV